jgi:hypothetical protein
MLADRHGELRWVTATNEAEQAFEQAQRDLAEGPCMDAFTTGRLVQTADLQADPRWPRRRARSSERKLADVAREVLTRRP